MNRRKKTWGQLTVVSDVEESEEKPPKPRFLDLQSYLAWFEKLLARSGGYFPNDGELGYQFIGDDEDEFLHIFRQRLLFHDGTFLEFWAAVNEQIECTEYHFHFQVQGGPLIWRIEKHDEYGKGEAIPHWHHLDSNGRERRDRYLEVDVRHVLQKISEYQRERAEASDQSSERGT